MLNAPSKSCAIPVHPVKNGTFLVKKIIMNAPQNEPTVTMFNKHQLADRWNMSVRTLQDWRHKKTGPKYIKFKGWSVRYPLDDVVEYEGKWLPCEVN